MLFRFDRIDFDYLPFPIGYIRDFVSADAYHEMVAAYPDVGLFQYKPELGKKYSLSEVNHPEHYRQLIEQSPIWKRVHDEIKSAAFIESVIEALKRANLDLRLAGRFRTVNDSASRRRAKLIAGLECLRHGAPQRTSLKSRFEFSMLPADGGHIKPHTDSPQKLITLVISMINFVEWKPEYGGGTAMLRAKDPRSEFNFVNKQLEFAETEELKTFPFEPNQCVIFVKTFNSLHAVSPMKGIGSTVMRKTLTLNIETA
jgi:hypothetical protein